MRARNTHLLEVGKFLRADKVELLIAVCSMVPDTVNRRVCIVEKERDVVAFGTERRAV